MGKHMRVLIVDDDAGDRTQICRLLKKSLTDVAIAEAASIADATDAMIIERPDVILLDYQLPGVDAFEGLDLLRWMDSFLPIVMVTGQGDELLAARAMSNGADEYVPKDSLSQDTLVIALNSSIEKAALRRQLAERQTELEQFARVLSHDLSAPLNQIHVFAENLQQDLKRGETDHFPEYFQVMSKASNDALHLIRLLSDFLRPGNREPERESFHLQNLLEEVKQMLISEKSGTSAEVVIDADITLNSNYPLLKQIFQNLISNGLKFNRSDKPTVWVSASRINSACEVRVRDNGIGISAENMGSVFHPFVRVQSDQEFKGAGLGLAISLKNAKRLGCTLRVEANNGGEGTTFILTHPLQQ